MDWFYVNSSRLGKNKKILSHIIRNNMEDVPFLIKEKRYRIINDEVVEVMYKIIYLLICLIQKKKILFV